MGLETLIQLFKYYFKIDSMLMKHGPDVEELQ